MRLLKTLFYAIAPYYSTWHLQEGGLSCRPFLLMATRRRSYCSFTAGWFSSMKIFDCLIHTTTSRGAVNEFQAAIQGEFDMKKQGDEFCEKALVSEELA